MPAFLWNKVNQHTVYAGWELGGAISTTTTKIGTDTTTMASSPHWLRSSVIGTTLTQVNDSPAGGNGSCWEFKGATTVNGTNNGYVEISGDHLDNVTAGNRTNYQVSFWFKFNFTTQEDGETTLLNWDPFSGMGFYVAMMSGSTRKLRIRNRYNDSGGVSNVASDASGSQFAANTWYLFTYIRNGSQWKVLINGVQVAAFGGLTSSESSGISYGFIKGLAGFNANTIASVGKYVRFHGLFWGPTTDIDANGWNETRIAELYTAGTSVPEVPVNYSASPMTASNAVLVMPSISTTTGIIHTADPLVASNSELVEPVFFADANYLDSFRQVNAILTMPTVSFTFNDNTQVVAPFITILLELINPSSVVAVKNINYSSDTFTASALMEQHTIVAGTGIIFAVDPFTASALSVNPSFYGPQDVNVNALSMIAGAESPTPTIVIPASYPGLVLRNSPYYYSHDGTAHTNRGTLDFGTVDKGPSGLQTYSIINVTSPELMFVVSEGVSLGLRQPYSDIGNKHTFFYPTQTGYQTQFKNMYDAKTFTIEFWWRPASYGADEWIKVGTDYWKTDITAYTTNTTLYTFIDNSGSPDPSLLSQTNSNSIIAQNWNHIVVTYEPGQLASEMRQTLWVNGTIAATGVFAFTPQTTTQLNLIDNFRITMNTGSDTVYTMIDEIAIYPTKLSNNEIIEHHSFISGLSPNKTINATPLTATAFLPMPIVLSQVNKNITDTPATGTALINNPTVIAQANNSLSATAITANALAVNPAFYGTPDYTNNASPMIANGEFGNNSFALDGTYFTYVNTNISPFRYVTFDGLNPLLDYGSDNDYSVTPTLVGGTYTNPAFGINNISVITNGTSYITDGVVLYESEYNDDWGTSTDHCHASFWIQRPTSETGATGLRVLWNLYGVYGNKYAILYHYNNRLHFEIYDGTETRSFTSTNEQQVFDYIRHHFVIVFDHSGNNHFARIYLDSALVLTATLDLMQLTTINGITPVGPNDSLNNYPRMSVGCLISPFGNSQLPAQPQNYISYVDEVHWAQTNLSQQNVINLYNAMPAKFNIQWNADFFIGLTATLPMPTVGTGVTVAADSMSASNSILLQPVITTEYELIFNSDIFHASSFSGNHSGVGDNITNKNILADVFIGSGVFVLPTLQLSFAAAPMLATVKAVNSKPYLSPYHILIQTQTFKQIGSDGSLKGSLMIGDIQ